MTDITASAAPTGALYRAVWRWHFYAGLLTLPFMILIAVTGAIYLFKDEINDALHADLRRVEPQASAPLAPSLLVAAALEAVPGTLRGYHPPAAPDRAAVVKLRDGAGEKVAVYLDPYDGAVLGHHWDAGFAGSRAIWVVRKLHSLEYVGWVGNRMIEAVAGWAVILAGTGLYLWWPRGRKVGVFAPRKAKGRPFWRDLHAVTGAYAALFIVFLAITGLPWSGFWGKQFYDLSYKAGIGMPDGYWESYPVSTVPTGEALERAPWILEGQPMPQSLAAAGVPVGMDQIVAKAEAMGVHPGFALNPPSGPEGVFTVSVYPDDITHERVVHFDQYSGEVLFDMKLADLGALGRAAEWGISVHMGQEFGVVNQIAMLLACIAIVLMSVAAMVMWWKRRPAGGLGAPSMPADFRVTKGIALVTLALAVFFPLVGLSLAVMLLIDLVLPRALRARLA
ncbi:MAG: PepSY-associated TM helix domain-containing protein [Pikeienuella sp.]|uniref:PepSY-associated TM helix domain-containing protein n=1 Tax=Pikeienuella sp. TaxID=2831957 RepID=UPI00391977E4